MKNNLIISILLILPYILSSQNFNNLKDAKTYFENNPPKYSFEGVYEINKDVKNELTDFLKQKPYKNKVRDVEPTEFNGYISTKQTIVIYVVNDVVYSKIIGESNTSIWDSEYNMLSSLSNSFIVSSNGVLIYKYIYKFNPSTLMFSDWATGAVKSEVKTSNVEIRGDSIYFEPQSQEFTTMFMDKKLMIFWKFSIKYLLKKIYKPTLQKKVRYGVGFMLDNKGNILTSSCLLDGGKKITLRNIRNSKVILSNLSIISEDINNQLAIVKIDDTSNLNLSKKQILITSKTPLIGGDLFVLNKYILNNETTTNQFKGKITSKVSSIGNVSQYQATINLKESPYGLPVFDMGGNLIGLFSCDNSNTNGIYNVIKPQFIYNLIYNLPNNPIINSTTDKSTSANIEELISRLFIIEVEY